MEIDQGDVEIHFNNEKKYKFVTNKIVRYKSACSCAN